MEFGLTIGGTHYTIDHITTNLMKNRLNNHVPLHKHPVFHFIYILEGRGVITVGSTTTAAKPGMLYVINPNEPHRFLFGDGVPLSNLESTFRLLDASGEAVEADFYEMADSGGLPYFPEALRTRPIVVPPRLKPLLTEGFERILELYGSPLMRKSYSFMVADLMTRVETVVRHAVRTDNTHDSVGEMIESIKHFLTINRNRPVTLRETAEFAHVTPNYLCRLFKERTGETPMGYLQSLRMREAGNLLSLTDLPVYTIAEKLGYEEPSYFARVFRSTYGESPQQYRRRLEVGNRIK